MRKHRESPPVRVIKPRRRFPPADVNDEDDDEEVVRHRDRFSGAEMRRLRRLLPFDINEDEEEEELPPPRHRRDEYEFGCEEEGGEDYRDLDFELLQALRNIATASYALERMRAHVARLVRKPQLTVKWKEFTSQGGIDYKDFENFLNDKFRSRLTRGKKHLRLVSSRNPPSIRLRRRDHDGPDEAA